MATKGYADQALEIIADGYDERPMGARLRSPDERRDLARDMLSRNGYTPSGTDEHGHTIYRRDSTRSSFAVLTLAHNGKPVAINPRRVLHVESQSWDGGAWETFVVLTHGDPIRVRESVAEAVEKIDAAAA